jgi:hypothetical protein
MRTALLALALATTAGCADRELGDVTKAEASTIYMTMRGELRFVHQAVLSSGEPPREPYNYPCNAGSITLQVGLDEDMYPERLNQTFDGCDISGLQFDGKVDYSSLEPCDDFSGTFAFSAGGLVDLAGSMNGFCYMEVRDRCNGTLTGHICGYPAADLMAP